MSKNTLATNLNKKCDCHVQPDPASGILRCYTKCRFHVRELIDEMRNEQTHFESLGALHHPEKYIEEFDECFARLLPAPPAASCLEIGAGTSPYIKMLQDRGYRYTAIESSPWAAQWLRQQPAVSVIEGDWETIETPRPVSLILAAHCIEHMKDAPGAIKKMADALVTGGVLYIIVPDNEDLCNPDHWWFFTDWSLRAAVEKAGFRVNTMATRRRIEREKFIYCEAVKL